MRATEARVSCTNCPGLKGRNKECLPWRQRSLVSDDGFCRLVAYRICCRHGPMAVEASTLQVAPTLLCGELYRATKVVDDPSDGIIGF